MLLTDFTERINPLSFLHLVNLRYHLNSWKRLYHCTIVAFKSITVQGATRRNASCITDERRDVESIVARLPSTTTTTTSGRPSSSSSYFWRSPVGLDHHTPWWGWLYGRGPPPAPFMGASRRMVTLPNFTTWSNDTEQIPLEITSFPRACMRGIFARDVEKKIMALNFGELYHQVIWIADYMAVNGFICSIPLLLYCKINDKCVEKMTT